MLSQNPPETLHPPFSLWVSAADTSLPPQPTSKQKIVPIFVLRDCCALNTQVSSGDLMLGKVREKKQCLLSGGSPTQTLLSSLLFVPAGTAAWTLLLTGKQTFPFWCFRAPSTAPWKLFACTGKREKNTRIALHFTITASGQPATSQQTCKDGLHPHLLSKHSPNPLRGCPRPQNPPPLVPPTQLEHHKGRAPARHHPPWGDWIHKISPFAPACSTGRCS